MRNMPIPMRVSPMVSSTQPLTQAAGRVLKARNPAAVQRLHAAMTDHRARMQADAKLAGKCVQA